MLSDLKRIGDEHATNVNEGEGRHRCNNCFCTGIVPIDLSFYEACFTCGGHGHLTWIDNATKNRRKDVNDQTVDACHKNNIVQAATILKRSLRSLNVGHVIIKLQFDNINENTKDKIQEIKDILKIYDL